jgi:hypothetical protein
MIRVAILTLSLLLVASAGFAPCWTPMSSHVEYWQYQPLCVQGGSCNPRWFLEGTCDIDCSGNITCTGDTHIDDNTRFVVTTADCDQVCD